MDSYQSLDDSFKSAASIGKYIQSKCIQLGSETCSCKCTKT